MASSSSSSNPFQASGSSSGSSASTFQMDAAWTAFEALLEKKLEEIKPKTPGQIKALGESTNKTIVIASMAGVLLLIIIFAGCIYLKEPADGKDFFGIVMPIITAIISGILGYLSGEKSSK